jgi:hypothetical protein
VRHRRATYLADLSTEGYGGPDSDRLALPLSRSICRRLTPTTLCDGFNRREAPDCRVSPKFAESESKSSCRLGARGSSETTNERRSRTRSNRSTVGRCWHRSQAAIFWTVLKAMNIVFDIWVSITRLTRSGRLIATSQPDAAPQIKVPSDPKILTPVPVGNLIRLASEAESRNASAL